MIFIRRTIRMFLPIKKFIKFGEKYSKLQLDCNKWNYTQIYTEKNGPNNRLIKKEKNQTISLTNLKEGPVESQLALSSSLE